MKLKYSTSKNFKVKDIDALRASVGWRRKRGARKWKEIINKSSFVYSVWDESKLIGMARILEDGVMCMIYDVVVHQDYQGQGIGKKIMQRLINETKKKDYISIGLFASSENKKMLLPFYKKFGFKVSKTGMEIKK